MMDALLADRIGHEEAEAAYTDLKHQIASIGDRFSLSSAMMATALTRAAFIVSVHLGDTPEDGINWLRKAIDTLELDSDY
jgi:hypothetical protein